MISGFLLVLLVSLPWLLAAVAGLVQLQVQRHLENQAYTAVEKTAASWAKQQLRSMNMKTSIEVQNDGLDGYWPDADCIRLNTLTACSVHPLHHAIVAHELGHAIHTSAHASLKVVFPAIRVATQITQKFAASFIIIGALYNSTLLFGTGVAFATVAAVLSGITLLDEGAASHRALELLPWDMPYDSRQMVRRAMMMAWTVYASGFLGQLGLLFFVPSMRELALDGVRVGYAARPEAVETWLLLVLLPLFILHTTQVFLQVAQPQAVRSEFRLTTMLMQDGQWEFITGTGVLLLIVFMHDFAYGTVFTFSVALAAITTVTPAATLVLLPLVPTLALLGRGRRPSHRPSWLRHGRPTTEQTNGALMR
ncbi:MAG: hypothetical protein HN348_13660, partial [Proteobacteria bacterium]|nr:hypothetical protein [Pseudomonadota bacterium]